MPDHDGASHPKGKDIAKTMPAFPGEFPQAHQAREWLEKLGDHESLHHLQAVQEGKMPLRVQHLRNWPAELCEMPDDLTARLRGL